MSVAKYILKKTRTGHDLQNRFATGNTSA